MEILNESFKSYFSCCKKLLDRYISNRESSLKAINRLQNHAEQFNVISRVELGSIDDLNPDDVKRRLLSNIQRNLDYEIAELFKIRKQMETEVYKLERLHDKVELALEDISADKMCCGIIPNHLLLERVNVTFRYYQASLVKFNCALMLCDYSNCDTIQALKIAATNEDFPLDYIKSSIEYGNVFMENMNQFKSDDL